MVLEKEFTEFVSSKLEFLQKIHGRLQKITGYFQSNKYYYLFRFFSLTFLTVESGDGYFLKK